MPFKIKSYHSVSKMSRKYFCEGWVMGYELWVVGYKSKVYQGFAGL